jgi:aldehyde dehydrogenase (NAD+)
VAEEISLDDSAAAGFGGYRESGFGREGGREGLYEYLRPAWSARPRPSAEALALADTSAPPLPAALRDPAAPDRLPPIDRTAKLFIGGAQKRPDGNYTRPVYSADGHVIGEVGDGNRKDIRDAVEAAANAAPGWGRKNGHARAQIVYYIAENLSARADEFARRLLAMGAPETDARREVEASIDRLFTWAAWADKFGGEVKETTLRGVVMGLHEPLGIIGIGCPDEAPLLALVSLFAPAVARGNVVVVVPSERGALLATDLYQVLETSDVPDGVINIVTGARDALITTLADHDQVEGVWYFGTAAGSKQVEAASAGNMKRTWVSYGEPIDWFDDQQGAGESFLHEATQVKHVWVPTGE